MRGKRGGVKLQRHIKANISANSATRRPSSNRPGVCHQNLKVIRCLPSYTPKPIQPMTVCVMNTQSVCNKTGEVVEYLLEKDIDLLIVTESWLFSDSPELGDLEPTGYKLRHVPRDDRQGGGILIIHKAGCKLQPLKPVINPTSFECMEAVLTSGNGSLRLIVVYRPQRPCPEKHVPTSVFFSEFRATMERHVTAPGRLFVTGDFNFHVDTPSDPDAKKLLDMLDSMNLVNFVHEPTHIEGHTLDLMIGRKSENIISNLYVDMQISDHFTVLCNVSVAKPHPERKIVKFRKLKSIDMNVFRKDVSDMVSQINLDGSVEDLVTSYNTSLVTALDKHAPLLEHVITIRHNIAWQTEDFKDEKRERRRLENRWRETRLETDRERFQEQRQKVKALRDAGMSEFYTTLVDQNKDDPKGMYRVIDSLLHRKKSLPLPPHESASDLAEEFSAFFLGKIEKIHLELTDHHGEMSQEIEEICMYDSVMDRFDLVTEEDVKKVISQSRTTSCELDPVPTWILKLCMDEILPLITAIVNASLESSNMPTSMKIAMIKPLLKKVILELILRNYRPVSNLPFISKVIERVVAAQVKKHVGQNNLACVFQSAYREGHSTETALLRVQNDILSAIDSQKVVILVLLDLSAAFDTISHEILLQRLYHRMGIQGAVHEWFASYLAGRQQSVKIGDVTSEPTLLTRGVPQGSVLGPVLFTLYMSPLADVMEKHNIKFHAYADDTQLYLSFSPQHQANADTAVSRMQNCIVDIRSWMISNFLKLNEEKTEFAIFGLSQQTKKITIQSIDIHGCSIEPQAFVKNLGAIFDAELKMNRHVNNVISSANHHLRNIRCVRKFMSVKTSKTAINAFVISRLDTNNSLLAGINKGIMVSLKKVQNAAARVILRKRKREEATPLLKTLHWLPICEKRGKRYFRVEYKYLVLTFKAIHGMAPQYLRDLIVVHQPPRSLRSKSKCLLYAPKTSLVTGGDRSFAKVAPNLWNALPIELRSCDSLCQFKAKLKTYLFSQAYP